MNAISHKQAIQLIHRRTDGLLTEGQRLSLEEHLHSCEACRAYAVDMDGLSAHLQKEFHRRWDADLGPSQNVFNHVTARARRIPVANRISFGAKLLAGAMALVVLGVAINFVVSRLQSTSPVANATETVDNASLAQNRLLAFASDQNGNFDIYTMHADGTDLTNLTNNPASDTNPIWSPDGKYIAFESDRDGFMQIYRMDANGSNVIQLTREKADHKLPLNRNGTHNPWSPDGSRLLFLQEEAGKDMKTLYSIDINGENKITLANGRISLYDVSWSPGGKHIAYLLDISPTTDKYVPNLYVVEPDGSNDRELKKLLPAEKQSDFIYSYYWSSNGQSIFLPASATDSLRAAIYQLDLQTNTFLNETETKIIVTDWSEGGSLIKDINQEGMPYVWERSDGTSNTFEASKAWDTTYDPSIASAAPCSLDLTRSTQNNFAFGVYCPDAKFNLYWTNADGSTIKQLLTLPMDVDAGGVGEIAWSPDDQYIAFNITSADKTDMYVVKVEEMLANPSSQPLQVSIGKGNGIPSWQPIVDENIAKEIPTPQPPPISSSNRLIAFASDQNGNSDIYTMHADGSGLANLTNNPAVDTAPFWSPDGKRIAFQSDRDGFMQIYLMDADGSNIIQLTHNETFHGFINYLNDFSPWSPDGTKLIFSETLPGEDNWKLYVIDANGENKAPLVEESNIYSAISWSPDGKRIALQADDPRNLGGTRLYVVNADGSDLREVTGSLQQNQQLSSSDYYWSPDGQSIFFVAFFQKTDPYWTAYEAKLDDNTLVEHARTTTPMYGWWNGISLLNQFNTRAPFKWTRPDGTSSTLDAHEKCQQPNASESGGYLQRSSNHNWIIGAYCPNGDTWFYWANSDGTVIKPLLDAPIPNTSTWHSPISSSRDDKFIAFTVGPADNNDLYILNISEALNDRLLPPVKMSKSFGPSWQPVSNHEIVEEEPTLEPTQVHAPEKFPPIGTGIENGEWIAFTGATMVPDSRDPTALTDNRDVYLIHLDGSGLVNLTNAPDAYFQPTWSPNGKNLLFLRDNGTVEILRRTDPVGFEVLVSTGMNVVVNAENSSVEKPFGYSWSPDSQQIAFLDNRAGNYDIYTIYADGRNDPQRKQLTNDPGQDFGFVWSPDGSHIAYQRTNGDQLSIMVMDADGSNQHEVARGRDGVSLRWSLDGNSIYANSIYRWPPENQIGHLECEGCIPEPAIYQIKLDGPSVHQIYYEKNAEFGWILYDTPQKGLYFMRPRPDHPSLGLWGTWMYWDGNSVHEIGEMDPQQTCKTPIGNIPNEHISPNERFSIITNFCAGGFDLYLADREAATPEQRLIHLLRLPLDTWGEGANDAYLPMTWSPDGRWLVYDDGNQSVYLLDIEQILRDPTTEPVILFQSDSNLFTFAEVTWQPKP